MQDLSQIQFVRFNILKMLHKTRITLRNNIVVEKMIALLRKNIVKFL